jgi:8-oxo-dGTP pyrophosphatase MutT (NUDIX family)
MNPTGDSQANTPTGASPDPSVDFETSATLEWSTSQKKPRPPPSTGIFQRAQDGSPFTYAFLSNAQEKHMNMLEPCSDGINSKFCQSCLNQVPSKTRFKGSFCSKKCFDLAVKHATGAVVVGLTPTGNVILARDTSRKGGVYEFPGGGRDENEDPVACALREFREEVGLKTGSISGIPTVVIRVLWYRKGKGKILTSYFICIVKIEGFDPHEATRASSSRTKDPLVERHLKECDQMVEIPLIQFFNLSRGTVREITSTCGQRIQNISERWINFLKNQSSVECMLNIANTPQINPLKIIPDPSSYVYSFADVHIPDASQISSDAPQVSPSASQISSDASQVSSTAPS